MEKMEHKKSKIGNSGVIDMAFGDIEPDSFNNIKKQRFAEIATAEELKSVSSRRKGCFQNIVLEHPSKVEPSGLQALIARIKLQQKLNERDNLLRAQVFVEQAEKIDRENKALREAIAEQFEFCKPSVTEVMGDFEHYDGGDMAERRDSGNQARLDCCGRFKRAVRLMEDEAQELERQSGRDFKVLANQSIQCSECIYARGSDMYAKAAVGRLRQPDKIIEWSSDEVTCGEIARLREPCAGREFIECSAAEALRTATDDRDENHLTSLVGEREHYGSHKQHLGVGCKAVQQQGCWHSGIPLTTFRGVSDAQETDARQRASVCRALKVARSTLASARSWATQSSEQLDPRRDSVSVWLESSYFEGVPVTTHRQVCDILASHAFMLGSALEATRGDCDLSVRLLESVNVEIRGGRARGMVQGLEATPVSGYSGAVTSASEGVEIASTCIGHLPAEGRDLMLKCCTRLAERDPGIGQLEPEGSLWDGGVTEYTTSQISEWGSGRAFVSAMGGAHGAVGAMVSESYCKPAEEHEQLRNEGVGLGTSGQYAQCAVAVHEQSSFDLPYQMARPGSVVLRGEDHQPAEGCGADGYSGNGLDGWVTDRVEIIRGGRTGVCCRKAALGHVDVDSQGWRLSQENGKERSTCYCEDRFDVLAGDAQRSGYHEIYSLNEALLSELCCISSRNESIQESLESDAFQEEWCLFDEEAIEVEIQHELVVAVDQTERVCYHLRGVTSARAILFRAMKEFLSKSSRTFGTARLQRFVAKCQQGDSSRDVVLARVFDPGGLCLVVIRWFRRFWESSKLLNHALCCTLLRLHLTPYYGRKRGEGGLCCSIYAA